MRFRFSKTAQAFFVDIIGAGGSHAPTVKNKFEYQFDVYYCCAMKAIKVLGIVGSFLLAGLLVVCNFIMYCIGLIIGTISKG